MSKLDLLSHTNEITTIECSTCNRVETIKDAAEQAIDELHKKGWRATKKKCQCPVCLAPGLTATPFQLQVKEEQLREVGC